MTELDRVDHGILGPAPAPWITFMSHAIDLRRIVSIRDLRRRNVERDRATANFERDRLMKVASDAEIAIEAALARVQEIAAENPLRQARFVTGSSLLEHRLAKAKGAAIVAELRGLIMRAARAVVVQDKIIADLTAALRLMDRALIKAETLVEEVAAHERRGAVRRDDARAEEAAAAMSGRR